MAVLLGFFDFTDRDNGDAQDSGDENERQLCTPSRTQNNTEDKDNSVDPSSQFFAKRELGSVVIRKFLFTEKNVFVFCEKFVQAQ